MTDSKAKTMRQNAENCSEMAQEAKTRAEKARFSRMEAAWKELARTQDWLDGKDAKRKVEGRIA